MKEPWATPNGATHKTCYPFQKKRDNSRKKNIKTSKSPKKYSKIQKIKKLEKLQKTLKNTIKRKREWSGSEAGAKRERNGRQENHGKP